MFLQFYAFKDFKTIFFMLLISQTGLGYSRSISLDILEDNILMNIRDDILTIYNCEDSVYPTIDNCYELLKQINIKTLDDKLLAEYNKKIESLSVEIEEEKQILINDDPSILLKKAQINSLNKDLNDLDYQSQKITNVIKSLQKKISDIQIQITFLNSSSMISKEHVISVLEKDKNNAVSDVNKNENDLMDLQSITQDKTSLLEIRNNELNMLIKNTNVNSLKLERLNETKQSYRQMKESYTNVIEKLKNETITFKSSSIDVLESKELKKIFKETVFDKTILTVRVYGNDNLLEVYSEGLWKGVCDDSFDLADAKVACRSMGKSFSSFSIEKQGISNSFWLDELGCNGNENSLFECSHNGLGNENCNIGEHISLLCI